MNRRFTALGLPYVPLPEDGGEGQNGGAGTPPAAPAAPPAPKPADPPAALSQADVDRIVNERLSRERAKFADYNDLKAKAAKYDEAEAAKAPELERVAKTAREEGAAEARATLNRERVLDKIEVAAAGKFTDPEDAQLHLGKRADEFIGKDGVIDTAAITKAVEQLLADKPHLGATKTTTPAPGRVGVGVGSASADAAVTPGLGRLQHAYAQSPHNK